MNKSHYNRFFHRNLTNQSTIDLFNNIARCKKCNKYNNLVLGIPNMNVYYCTFCNNPIQTKGKKI